MAETIDTEALLPTFSGREMLIRHEEICEATRAALLDSDAPSTLEGLGSNRAVYCYHRVWIVAKLGEGPNPQLNEELKKDRKGKCSFFAHRHGVPFDVAATDQRLQAARREKAKDRWLKRVKFILVVIGTAAAVVGALIALYWVIWYWVIGSN